MDGKEKLRVSEFSIQDGNWQEQAANIRVVEPKSRSHRNRGSLYILIEPPHDKVAAPALYSEVVTTIVDTYYGTSGSITRGLRNALLAANTLLFEKNLRADNAHRMLLGVSCAVIRGKDVYTGQMGPALISLVHEGALTRYPENSIWLRSESPGAFDLNREPAVGLRVDIEPDLSHLSLVPGDVLLLSTTSLARMARHTSEASELTEAVTCTDSESIRENLETLASGRDLSAIIIEYPRGPLVKARGGAPSSTKRDEPTMPEPSQEPQETLRQQDAEVVAPQETTPQRSAPPPSTSTIPASASGPWEETGWEAKAPDSDAGVHGGAPSATDGAPSRPSVNLEALRQGADKMRRSTEDFLMRILPDEEPKQPAKEKRREPISLSGRGLIAVALAIPLVMLALVIMTRVRYENTRREQFEDIKIKAQTTYTTALNTPDIPQLRQGLYDALAIIEDGKSINPNDDTLNSLARRIRHKLNDIDVIHPLYHFWQLADLGEEAATSTDSSRIVVHGIDVFLLNRGSDRVYHYLLNDVGDALQPLDGREILVQKGELRSGVQLGDMVDINWMEAGGQRTLSTFVTLERAGTLLAYDPQQGIDVLPVADSDMWLNPQAIDSYYGNLYVLDPLLGRILKYVPTDNVYTNAPSDYLSHELDIDLTGAVDMAIDGNVYVLFADGRIIKFLKGEPQLFSMNGLPTPMKSPTSLFVSGPKEPDALGYVYVADTGNERIVQFDKDGNFMRQFKAQAGESQLQQLRGLYVDEERGRIFFVSGKTLWLADMRPLQ